MKLMIKETTLLFFESIEDILKEGNIVIRPNEYSDHIAAGDHRYFSAHNKNKLVGVSAMVRFIDQVNNKTRIYHRAAWTHPDYRKTGVWTKLMKHKLNYINDFNWCENNTIHMVTVAITDHRYRNLGWQFWNRTAQNTQTGQILRDTWYVTWGELKKQYGIE